MCVVIICPLECIINQAPDLKKVHRETPRTSLYILYSCGYLRKNKWFVGFLVGLGWICGAETALFLSSLVGTTFSTIRAIITWAHTIIHNLIKTCPFLMSLISVPCIYQIRGLSFKMCSHRTGYVLVYMGNVRRALLARELMCAHTWKT